MPSRLRKGLTLGLTAVSIAFTGCGKKTEEVGGQVHVTLLGAPLCTVPADTSQITPFATILNSCNQILKGWIEQNQEFQKIQKQGSDLQKVFEIIQYYNNIFDLYAKLSPEGQKAIQEQEDWKRYIVGGNRDGYQSVLRQVQYFGEVFTEYAKLSPEGQKAIQEQEEWKRYIANGNKDYGKNVLGLFEKVKKLMKEHQIIAQLPVELQMKIKNGETLESIDREVRSGNREQLDLIPFIENGVYLSDLGVTHFPSIKEAEKLQGTTDTPAPYPADIPTSALESMGSKYREPNTYNAKDGEFNIYFPTDGSSLDTEDTKDLILYLEALMKLEGGFPKDITLSGYADMRGSDEHNMRLSNNRIHSIKRAIEKFAGSNGLSVKLQIASYGKGQSTIQAQGEDPEEALAKDRRVDISPSATDYITNAIKAYPADIYLIDLSVSMGESVGSSGKNKIQIVQAANFKKGAKMIGFSSGHNTKETTPIPLAIHPDPIIGTTPLYSALVYTIHTARQGDTITLVSDGQGNDGHLADKIIPLAKKKGLHINILGIAIPEYLQGYFRELAKATGGNYYVSNE